MTDPAELAVDEQVDDVEPLAAEFMPLTEDGLDEHEAKAKHAAAVLNRIINGFIGWLHGVEDAERALLISSATSQRASEAHRYVLAALDSADSLVGDLSNAEDSLNFHWSSRAPQQS